MKSAGFYLMLKVTFKISTTFLMPTHVGINYLGR